MGRNDMIVDQLTAEHESQAQTLPDIRLDRAEPGRVSYWTDIAATRARPGVS